MELNNNDLLNNSKYGSLLVKTSNNRKNSLSIKKSKSIEGKLVNKADKINSINEIKNGSGLITFVFGIIKIHM